MPSPPGSVDVIPTAGCAQCARCSLLTFVRAWALGAHFLRSYVRDRVRARLRSLDGVPSVCFVCCLQLFCSKPSICSNLFFVRRNFDKFSTILASIVFYDPRNSGNCPDLRAPNGSGRRVRSDGGRYTGAGNASHNLSAESPVLAVVCAWHLTPRLFSPPSIRQPSTLGPFGVSSSPSPAPAARALPLDARNG